MPNQRLQLSILMQCHHLGLRQGPAAQQRCLPCLPDTAAAMAQSRWKQRSLEPMYRACCGFRVQDVLQALCGQMDKRCTFFSHAFSCRKKKNICTVGSSRLSVSAIHTSPVTA